MPKLEFSITNAQYCWQIFSTTMQNILGAGGSNSIIAVLGISAPKPKLSHMIHYMLKMTFCWVISTKVQEQQDSDPAVQLGIISPLAR